MNSLLETLIGGGKKEVNKVNEDTKVISLYIFISTSLFFFSLSTPMIAAKLFLLLF